MMGEKVIKEIISCIFHRLENTVLSNYKNNFKIFDTKLLKCDTIIDKE